MALIREKPEPLGYAMGEYLDRWRGQEIEKFRHTGRAVACRCNSCAFRKRTYANGCVPTVMDAQKCALEDETIFLCYELRRGDQPPVCAGYVLAAG
jgi:hypothetical protein